jgi:hypothetical protein
MHQNIQAQVQNLIDVIPMADITATGNGTGIDITSFVGEAKFVLSAKNVAGTTPTLDVKLQDSADNSTFNDIAGAAFTQVTDAGTKAAVTLTLNVQLDSVAKYIRAVKTIGGTASPEFLIACHGLAQKQVA